MKNLDSILKNDISFQTAKNAYRGTSFDPEKRGRSAINAYVEYLEDDYGKILKIVGEENIDNEFATYREKAKKLYLNWMYAKGNCMSTMITGGSNFPVARNQKMNDRERAHGEKFFEFREKAIAGIRRRYRKKVDRLEEYKEDLAKREKAQERMKAANKIARSKKLSEVEKRELLEEMGYKEKTIDGILTADYRGVGFPSYMLTNNNANIKRIKQQIAKLEARKQIAESEEPIKIVWESEGMKIVQNFEAERYQILFDEKPDYDTRKILKSNGFKWAPSQSAWQRFLTGNSRWAVDRVIKELS